MKKTRQSKKTQNHKGKLDPKKLQDRKIIIKTAVQGTVAEYGETLIRLGSE